MTLEALTLEALTLEWEVIGVCEPSEPLSVAGALGLLERALDALNAADHGSLPGSAQAGALRALEKAASKHTAARAAMLTAFTAHGGYEDDGQGSARTWLRWQTRTTAAAAGATVAWARRLAAHPVIAAGLAAGELSESWARQICDWTGRLPEHLRGDADEILTAAARGGADLADLARLAEEMYERSRRDDGGDHDRDRLDERGVWLGRTLGGAGRLEGDLTAGCAAALSAVLDALSKKAGPEDTRTAAQRRHDALAEACQRLIAAGMIPAHGGQATQIQVHMTLAELRAMPGAADAEAAWIAARAGQDGWLAGPDASAALCDGAIAPTVAGHVDPAALDRLVELFLAYHRPPASAVADPGQDTQPAGSQPAGSQPGTALPPETLARLRAALLHAAADALSGPAGLASWLRRSLLTGPAGTLAATPSLPLDIPLDVGQIRDAIPPHLRRAVTTRHRHCAFPGCRRPARGCHIHHITPRSHGGPTALGNLIPLCEFHHLIAVHQWGWQISLHPDGTTTATSPNGRTLHSHSPPSHAA